MKMKRLSLTMVGMVVVLALSSYAWSEEITYRKHIKPLLDAKCMGCHGADSPEHPEFKESQKRYEEMSKGPKMDTYTNMIYFVGWRDTGALMRRLDDGKKTKDGKPGNMFQYLGSSDEERQKNLRLFKEWVGKWTLKRWPEITKVEFDGIKVKY